MAVQYSPASSSMRLDEIVSSPTFTATPGWAPPQPESRAATTARAATRTGTGTGSRGLLLLCAAPGAGRSHQSMICRAHSSRADPDDRLAPDHRGLRARHEDRVDRRLDDALGIDPVAGGRRATPAARPGANRTCLPAIVTSRDRRPGAPGPGTARPAAARRPPPAARRSGRPARRAAGRRRRRRAPRPAACTSPGAAARWGCSRAAGGRRPAARSGPRAAPASASPPWNSCDRLADQPHVEVEADVGDVAGLLAAEQVAGAADLEVLHRDRHAAAEVGVLRRAWRSRSWAVSVSGFSGG